VHRKTFESEALACLHPLFRYAVRLSQSYDAADELVQETYRRALSAWQTVGEPSGVRPVLFRILHNYFVDEWRKKQRRPSLVPYENFNNLDTARFRAPDTEALREALSDEVIAALDELDNSLREILLLRELEDFSYQELSDILDLPIGTVRSRLARARRQVARRLQDYARQRGIIARRERNYR